MKNRPVLIGLGLFIIVFAVFLYTLKQRQIQNEKLPEKKIVPSQPEASRNVIHRRINVKLFFNDSQSGLLGAEDRSIIYEEPLQAQVREVVKELIKGPTGQLNATIPKETVLRDLLISSDGTAYVDFSSELATHHQGGSLAEIITVYSIVNTLTLNFPQIKRVQILLNDKPVETLNGHLDLTHPLRQDLSFVRAKPNA